MKRIYGAITLVLLLMVMAGCAGNKTEQSKEEPEPIVIENDSEEETENFREEVSREVRNVLSGDISIVVYAEGVEAFQYVGKAEVVNDGSGGEPISLVIYADYMSKESDWF